MQPIPFGLVKPADVFIDVLFQLPFLYPLGIERGAENAAVGRFCALRPGAAQDLCLAFSFTLSPPKGRKSESFWQYFVGSLSRRRAPEPPLSGRPSLSFVAPDRQVCGACSFLFLQFVGDGLVPHDLACDCAMASAARGHHHLDVLERDPRCASRDHPAVSVDVVFEFLPGTVRCAAATLGAVPSGREQEPVKAPSSLRASTLLITLTQTNGAGAIGLNFHHVKNVDLRRNSPGRCSVVAQSGIVTCIFSGAARD